MSNPYEDEKTSEGEGESRKEALQGGAAKNQAGQSREGAALAQGRQEESGARKKSAAGRRTAGAGRRTAGTGRVRELPDVRPAMVRPAVEQILPPGNPKKPPLGALRIIIFGREEIEVDASRTPAGWKMPYYWVVYFEPAGERGFRAIVHHRTSDGDSIPIPGDYGRYYVAAQTLTGKITGKSNIVTQTADSPSPNPPQKAAAAGNIRIPGETPTPIKVARSDRRFFGTAA